MAQLLRRRYRLVAALSPMIITIAAWGQSSGSQNSSSRIGREVAVPVHLQDGEEFTTPIMRLIQYGSRLFGAKFTVQEGAGRPQSKGTGAPISDPSSPLYSRGISTASPRPIQTRALVVTIHPCQVQGVIV